ncbi:uncharacterized protein RAG0_11253 [Rhynchosporium agropyri]|uniref:Uncharacterized protein n=1 Tax=Rhynchosporium agropyri TaxID=914238 RepID=A0A1E1L3E2_9HELO|nr:uncharacterized protein RAG0_11253 [Rhynchosporium agropyri]
MPSKVINSGTRWHVNDDGVYLYRITRADATSYLKHMQEDMREEVEARRSREDQAMLRWQVEPTVEEEDINPQKRAEGNHKKSRVGTKLLEMGERDVEHREPGKDHLCKDRLELTVSKWTEEEMIEVLRLEKICLDRDRAELADRERDLQEQLEQVELARRLPETEMLKREEILRTQQDSLEIEKLQFELFKIEQSEEARKSNTRILDRDRVVQDTYTLDRVDRWLAEANCREESACRRQQEVWDVKMEKLHVRADELKELEARVLADIEERAAVEQDLSLRMVEEDSRSSRDLAHYDGHHQNGQLAGGNDQIKAEDDLKLTEVEHNESPNV